MNPGFLIELTEPGEIVQRAGVTLVGLKDLPSTMPYHASTLYSRNVQALLLHLAPEGELTPDEMEAQQQALEGRIADFDAVITTAAVPGRPAPKIIPASAVEAMRPGSVIVDLAAETGGNCELTQPGEIVERSGVTLVGLTNLPSTMPYHASTLYSRNVQALLLHLAPEGELELDWSDEITSGACVAGKQEVAA